MNQRTDGRYQAQAVIGGRRRVFYSRISKEDAQEKASKAKAAYQPDDTNTPTFAKGSFAEFVFTVWWPRRREQVRPTTRLFYNELLRHVLPRIGHLPIESIGFDEVSAAVENLRSRRKGVDAPLSAKRRKEAVQLIRSVLGLYAALEAGRTGRQVRTDWKLVETPKPPRKKQRTEPSPDLTHAVMAGAKGTWLEGPVFCALFLALRRGEICGLKWNAIDRRRMTLAISEQRHERLPDGSPPKAGRVRHLALDAELLAILDATGDKTSEYVFTHAWAGRTRPIAPNGLTDAVTALCAQAGYPGVTLHDLRAYAASNLMALGVDAVVVKDILGHADLKTTELYLYSQEDRRRAALASLLRSYMGSDPSQSGKSVRENR